MLRKKYIPLVSLLLTACSAAASVTPIRSSIPTTTPVPEPAVTPEFANDTAPFPTNIRVDDDNEYIIPHMLGFDAIRPIYDPHFVTVESSPLDDKELVMGVALGGEAKAYPVTVLRSREMVNDEIEGWPVLVSW